MTLMFLGTKDNKTLIFWEKIIKGTVIMRLNVWVWVLWEWDKTIK